MGGEGGEVGRLEQLHDEAMRSGQQEGIAWLDAADAKAAAKEKAAALATRVPGGVVEVECDAASVRLRTVARSSAPVASDVVLVSCV